VAASWGVVHHSTIAIDICMRVNVGWCAGLVGSVAVIMRTAHYRLLGDTCQQWVMNIVERIGNDC
jgi:hypothetical protein